MGLISEKGGTPIPDVPVVRFKCLDERVLGLRTGYDGPIIVEIIGELQFYLLECGHRIETPNVDPVDIAFGVTKCHRCWEALLGTEESE